MDKATIRTVQDLRDLPNYLESVDPLAQPLSRIVTGYYLNEEYPCGLKSCHQPHREGFLVELEDGNVTNVGWKCGERFGDKFTAERTRYAERVLRPKAISTILDLIAKLPAFRGELAHLAAEADRLSRCKLGMRSRFPKLYAELNRRAHSGNDRIAEQIERSKKEIDDLHALNPGTSRERYRYREEPRGVLPGLRTLATNVRDDVVSALTGKVDAILTTTVASLATDNLLQWEYWALHFDEVLARARSTVAAGNALFSPESFRLMTYIATVDTERAALSKLTADVLAKDVVDPVKPSVVSAAPAALSKKQRDIQKRLKATLQNGKHLGR